MVHHLLGMGLSVVCGQHIKARHTYILMEDVLRDGTTSQPDFFSSLQNYSQKEGGSGEVMHRLHVKKQNEIYIHMILIERDNILEYGIIGIDVFSRQPH